MAEVEADVRRVRHRVREVAQPALVERAPFGRRSTSVRTCSPFASCHQSGCAGVEPAADGDDGLPVLAALPGRGRAAARAAASAASGGGISSSTSIRSRSGCPVATRKATSAPLECPTRTAPRIPSASMNFTTSSAISGSEYSSGHSLSARPRRSSAMTRKCSPSAGRDVLPRGGVGGRAVQQQQDGAVGASPLAVAQRGPVGQLHGRHARTLAERVVVTTGTHEGTPGGTRTPNRRGRNPLLCPVELQALGLHRTGASGRSAVPSGRMARLSNSPMPGRDAVSWRSIAVPAYGPTDPGLDRAGRDAAAGGAVGPRPGGERRAWRPSSWP